MYSTLLMLEPCWQKKNTDEKFKHPVGVRNFFHTLAHHYPNQKMMKYNGDVTTTMKLFDW
jgi:hypothetical protein